MWWSRFERPSMHSWVPDGEPMRLLEQVRPEADKPVAKEKGGDGKRGAEPKALACYGLYVHLRGAGAGRAEKRVWLRFADGRPVSGTTTRFLAWCCDRLRSLGKTALLLVRDNASWHTSAAVREWIAEHNRKIREGGEGVRILPCPLPSKSPWLNPIEPEWVHGKRRVAEPDRLLSAAELESRVYDCFDCEHQDRLSLAHEVA